MAQTRERNPNWRGGRTVASNGYILIRVGAEHHLADSRGYAYEHRLVAEAMVGRKLSAGEQIHHRNGNKADNREENLEICPSCAHHRVAHRKKGFSRRLPEEGNALVACACGCGATFLRFDDCKRPRRYLSGHNPIPAPSVEAAIAALASGPLHRTELARHLGVSVRAAASALSKLKRAGQAGPRGSGVWGLTKEGEV